MAEEGPDDTDDEAPAIVDESRRRMAQEIIRENQSTLTQEELDARVEMIISGDRMEDLLIGLEQRLLTGQTRYQRYSWAKRDYDVDWPIIKEIETLIRAGWKLEQLEPVSMMEKRHKQVLRHMVVFNRAMELDDLKEANKALENISKIEGLMMPDTNVHVNIQADVTSKTRERIQSLVERAKEKFTERQKIIRQGRLSVIDAKSEDKKDAG